MKVEITKQTTAEQPVVVGGIYKRVHPIDDGPNVLMLIQNGGDSSEYAWLDPESGEGAWGDWIRVDEVIDDINEKGDELVYCPNARLVIEE